MHRGVFIASTGQHVGKSTSCLGLVSGLSKRLPSVGFMKPVGQEFVETDTGLHADKDVVLFKECFHLTSSYSEMSPVLFPKGFTRDYLDGKVQEHQLKQLISESFSKIQEKNAFTVVEGTGHTGVGSIVNLNNAQVAVLLKLPVILIASGGLGSAFDELALNKEMCERHGAKVIGVILNRVIPEKRTMILDYMSKALSRWNLPLLGAIPFDPFLSNPSMKDFESLFHTSLLSGERHLLRHFKQTRLVATSVDIYQELLVPSQLIITPANREDIILATLSRHWEMKLAGSDLEAGMILTGGKPPREEIVEQIRHAEMPMLYTPFNTYTAMTKIASFTAKIRQEDVAKVKEAIDVVEAHLNLDQILHSCFLEGAQ